MVVRSVFACLVPLSLIAGCGGGVPSSSSPHIVGGQTFNPPDLMYRSHAAILTCFQAPVTTADMTNPTFCAPICSGTIVASQWILTAAHCTPTMTFTNGYVGLFYGSGITQSPYRVVDIRLPDGESQATLPGIHLRLPMNDIALLKLDKPIPLGDAFRAMPIANTFAVAGLKAWIMGNGAHNGVPNPFAQLLWREVTINTYEALNDRIKLGSNYINPGDSGSGLFTWNDALGRLEIQGVASWVNAFWPFDDSGYTYVGGRHRNWIARTIQ